VNGPVNVTQLNTTAISITENVTYVNGTNSTITLTYGVLGGGLTYQGYPVGFYASNGSIVSGGEYDGETGAFCSVVLTPVNNNNGSNGVKIYISLALIVLMNIFIL